MTTISEYLCSAAQPWTFSVPASPPAMAPGNYTIVWNGTNVNGQCLALDNNNNVVTTSSGCGGAYWYFTSQILSGTTSYYLNYVPNGWTTSQGNAQTIVPTGNSDNCTSENQLVYSNDQTTVSSLPIQISTDNTIFNNDCSYYYVPSSTGKMIVASTDQPSSANWKFTSVSCPTPTAVATGLYSISFQDSTKTTQYLTAVLNDPNFGNIIKWTSTFNMATCAWNYDATAKTLSTGCSSSPMYLYFNPSNPTFAELTATQSSASTTVVLTSNIIMVSDYQALCPLSAKGIMILYSCLSPTATMSVTSLESVPPTTLMTTGNYNLKYGGQCLTVDTSNNVTLTTCPAHPTIWTYDNTKNTLSYNGQCLLNNNLTCGTNTPLSLGDCTKTAQSQRFVMGQNGRLFDPVLKFCYSPTGTTLISGHPSSCGVNSVKCQGTSRRRRSVLPLLLMFIVISLVTLLAFHAYRKLYVPVK